MKPKTSLHPPDGVFSIAVSRPPLPTSDKGYRNGMERGGEESPLRNTDMPYIVMVIHTDMPYIVMVIQSVIIFITLSAFILYVFSPRSMPHLSPTAAPSFTVTFENAAPNFFPPPNPPSPSSPPSQPEPEGNRKVANSSSILPPTSSRLPPPSSRPLPHPEGKKQPSPGHHHSHTMLGKFRKAAVASDHGICSEIGRSILTRGGNAVDAAIATLLCVGVTNPQSSGIGGGFFMQFYQKEKGVCTTINARETAPGNVDVEDYQKFPDHTWLGWKSIGVPGEIKGFWRAFTDFGSGKVTWSELLEPTIKLCRDGIPVSEYLARILVNKTAHINKNNEMREMFTNPATNRFYKEGETMHRPKLAKTLQVLASSEDPATTFYTGELAATMVKEIQEGGGYLSLEDLDDYEPIVDNGVSSSITESITQCGPAPPSSWIVTQLIVRIMAELYPAPRRREDLETVLFYHRLIEAEKFAYAKRNRLGDPKYPEYRGAIAQTIKDLTDPDAAKIYAAKIKDEGPQADEYYEMRDFTKEDHGTSHVSVIDEQGNAVAVTSTINLWLGSMTASSLGIIWNNEMDDFGVPGTHNQFGLAAAPENYIKPGKTPMSSMSPTIIYNETDHQVRVVIGTTGGSKIIQGIASVVVRSLLFNQTIKEAIDAPQLFNQMSPAWVQYESDVPEHILTGLRAMGHDLRLEQNMPAVTHALFVDEKTGYIYANSDKRSPVHMHPDGY